jgi:DNA primase
MILLNVEQEISDIAHQYLDGIKRSGSNNIMALCPFHAKLDGSAERRPSFAMNLSNGLYLCHACGTKGNLYTFLRDVGIDRGSITTRFGDLLKAAISNSPAPLDPIKPNVAELDPIPESLLGLFDACPLSLLNAGFTESTLRHFDIGFDSTHNRITFPLRDYQGRLSGISGRDVTGDGLRYKVYDREYANWGMPSRFGFDKRKILWNVHSIYPDLYFNRGERVIVGVEGFKACMWVWQAGIRNVVAFLGTYISDEQLWMLERLGATLYLFLDHNEAGQVGTAKAIERVAKSCPLRIMEYPARVTQHLQNAQPDSLTPEEVHHAHSTSVDYVTWLYCLNQNTETPTSE